MHNVSVSVSLPALTRVFLVLSAFTAFASLSACTDPVHPAQIDCEKLLKKQALLTDAPLTVLAVVKGEAEAVLTSRAAADATAEQAPACVSLRKFVDEVTDTEREKRLLAELTLEQDQAKADQASTARIAVQIDGLCRAECEGKTETGVGQCEKGCGCVARQSSRGLTYDCPNKRAKRCRRRCKKPSARALKRAWDGCMKGCEKRALGDAASENEPASRVSRYLQSLEKLRTANGPLDKVATLSARIARATTKRKAAAKASLSPAFLATSSSCCPAKRKKRADGLCLAHTDYRYLHCLLREGSQSKLDPGICCTMCHGAKKSDVCDIRGPREACYLECVSDARRH